MKQLFFRLLALYFTSFAKAQNKMNYIFYLKQQVRIYIAGVLSFSITYGVMRYFGWDNPIILTSGHIGAFIGGTLSHIFLVPLCFIWFVSLKK